MKNLEVFKEKAIQLRKSNMSLDEISTSLNINKTTVYYWIKDIEAHILRRPCTRAASIRTRNIWAERRQAAYDQGLKEYPELLKMPFFRDFILLYICEGYKRNRNSVSMVNTDPQIIRRSFNTMKLLTDKKPGFLLQLHLDNDQKESTTFWGNLLNIDPSEIKVFVRKTNMTNRTGRLPNGIFCFRYNDTFFRSRIQAWIDCIKKEWSER